jgi:hypothetical protein
VCGRASASELLAQRAPELVEPRVAAAQQPSTAKPDGISDIGSFEQVPYRLEPQMNLRAEDRYEKDQRTLRARQQSERDSMMKSFGAERWSRRVPGGSRSQPEDGS